MRNRPRQKDPRPEHALRRDNRSGFQGVAWSKSRGQWRGEIRINKKQYHLGFFDDVLDAGEAVVAARLEHKDEIEQNYRDMIERRTQSILAYYRRKRGEA